MIYVVYPHGADQIEENEVCRYVENHPTEVNGFDLVNFEHVAHAEDEPVVPQAGRVLTKLEYLRRFTAEERIAIRQAAKSSPILDDYLAMLELAEEIDTRDADTIGALGMLEKVGLISAGRAQEILNG